jgi:hypothetical protein
VHTLGSSYATTIQAGMQSTGPMGYPASAPPSPASAANAVGTAGARPASAAQAETAEQAPQPDKKKKRGFWGRLFGRGGG